VGGYEVPFLSRRFVRLFILLLVFTFIISGLPSDELSKRNISGAEAASIITGDLDGDCDVDRLDLNILLRDRNKPVSSSLCGTDCDLDGDGIITVLDARKLVLLCTAPGCAILESTCSDVQNSPPVADAGPDQTVFVGDTVQLDGSGSYDVDGDLLTFTWTFVSRPIGSNAVISDSTAVMPTFVVDAPGTYVLQLIVNDGIEDSAPDTVSITTQNSPPVADAGPDQTVFVGDTVQLDGSGSSDVDGDLLAFTWTFVSRPIGSNAVISDNTAVMPTFVVDAPGTYVLQLIVNDGTEDSAPDTVSITTQNSPPVADAGPDQTVFVGDTVELDGSGSYDVDYDPLTYYWSFTSIPQDSNTQLDDPGLKSPTFVPDVSGLYVLQLIVNDGSTDSTPDTIKVSAEINHPPVITSNPFIEATRGQLYQYQVTATDPDSGDTLSFSLDVAPAGMSIDPSSGLITWIPASGGNVPVQVRVTDSHGNYDLQTYNINVLIPGSPPVIVPVGDRTIDLNKPLQIKIYAIDPDPGDTLVFSLVGSPAGMSIDSSSGLINWSPTEEGTYSVRVMVTDSFGLQDTADFSIIVTQLIPENVINHAPSLESIADQQILVGDTLLLQANATDPDGDPLTYMLINGPPGFNIDPSGRIQWTANTPGIYDVVLQVADPAGLIAATSFMVTVFAPNRPPLANDDIYTARTGRTLTVKAPGVMKNDSDPDSNILRAVVVQPPSHGQLTLNSDGSFDYTPAPLCGSDPVTTQVNLIKYPGIASITASSNWPGYEPSRVIDGNLNTSWFTNAGDAASTGATPYLEVAFDQDVIVSEIRIYGNREYANGYDFIEGKVQLYDVSNNLLYESGLLSLPAPDRDLIFTVSDVANVRRVRFTITNDENPDHNGMAEFEVYGKISMLPCTLQPKIKWSYPTGFAIHPVVADLDGDGIPEVIAGHFNGPSILLTVNRGDNGDLIADRRINGIYPESSLSVTVGDIDEDGKKEILYISSNRVIALEDDLSPKWISDQLPVRDPSIGGYSARNSTPLIVDIDSDGIPEIVIGHGTGSLAGITVFENDGRILFTSNVRSNLIHLISPPGISPVVADINLDGWAEIIYANVVFSHTGEVLWISSEIKTYSQVAVANLDDDPYGEVVLCGIGGELAVVEHDGITKWIVPGASCGAPVVADFNNDGLPEIGVHNISASKYMVFRHDGSLLWEAPGFGFEIGATVFDFDKDGTKEVVLVYNGIHFLDGRDGHEKLLFRSGDFALPGYPSLGARSYIPIVADIDADDRAELLITTEAGVTTVLEDILDSWLPARKIYNTYNYTPTLVNLDGSIPEQVRPWWLISGLNGFHINPPLPEERPDRYDSFTYKVNDGRLESNTATVHLEILPPNEPPRILSRPDTTATLGVTYVYAPVVVDPDVGDTLTYTLTDAPGGMTIDPDTGVIRWTPGPGPKPGDVLTLAGIASVTASSSLPRYDPDRVVDGNLDTSWFSNYGDAANLGTTPYLEVELTKDARITEIQMYGNRQFATGYDFYAGVFDLYAADGTHLYSTGIITLPAPDRDITVNIPDVEGVRRIRFTATDDETDHNGFAELKIKGYVDVEQGVGQYGVGLMVTDSQGESAFQSYILTVGEPVVVPDVVGQNRTDALAILDAASLTVGEITETYNAILSAGTVIAQTPPAGAVAEYGASVDLTISKGPGPGDTDSDGDSYTPNQGDCNDSDPLIFPGATDVGGDGIDQNCDGIDGVLSISSIIVEPSNSVVLTGQAVYLKATAVLTDGTSINLNKLGVWSSTDPTVATVDTNGVVTTHAAGSVTISLSHLGVSGNATITVVNSVPADQSMPVAIVDTPLEGDEVTAPVDVIGTVKDDNLLRYELSLAPSGSDDYTIIGSGTTEVDSGVLGRLDPTLLTNGLYTLRLQVFDRGGNLSTYTEVIKISGAMKVGIFSLSFTDLQIPLAGIPITVVRTYDSRDKTDGDFGIGWRLGIQTFQCRSSGVPGEGWEVVKSGLAYALVPTRVHEVVCTMPDGRVEAFTLSITPNISPLVPFPPYAHTAEFKPQPGTRGKLESLDNNHLTLMDPQPGEVSLLDDATFRPYNPQRFKYTAADGTQIIFTLGGGIESIVDRNGNTLTFTTDGILHSAGKSVTFTRDPLGRITAITDPAGNTQTYSYNTNGDLIAHTDSDGNTTRFKYDYRHNLIEIIDPLNRPVVRNEYNEEGRLIRSTNADGRTLTFTHDLDTRQEVVTDVDGKITVFEYDEHGNIVRVTDPLGNVTTHTYDVRGNRLSTTNAEGETTTWTYDARGNKLTETNPLGETTSWTYNNQNQITSITDALGRTTTFTYDSRGNLLTRTNAVGVIELKNTYDVRGNLLTSTDALGNTTRFEYDIYGNRIAEIDPLGNRTTWVYDASGNVISKTDRRGNTTLYDYNKQGLIVQTTDPLGNNTAYGYTITGVLTQITDALGHTTSREVDAVGKIIATVDAEGNRTERQYDIKGNLTAVIDPRGHTTRMEYDALQRLIKKFMPDGTATRVQYDKVGRIIAQTDGRGNTTHYAYDAAGRLVQTTDPSGNITRFEYDAVGNMTRMIDANGHVFNFTYDPLNRRIRTTFPDGSLETVTYDAAGHVIAQTDVLGNTTTFDYDQLGRLVRVVDPMGGKTTYQYDKEGNLIAQTDALGHSTTFSYDANGRRISKTYPDGTTETWAYDAAGNIHTRTDANGNTITQYFDANGRLLRKVFPDGTEETFTYTATGKVATASNASGTVVYTYDVNDRLIRLDNPDGSSIEYAYDGAGNLVSMTYRTSSVAAGRTTTYTYDTNNRLSSVTDPDGGLTSYSYDAVGNLTGISYPNGVLATFIYDVNNHLTEMIYTKGGVEIEHYKYQVNAAGDRTLISRLDGTSVSYEYDALRRLTHETVKDIYGNIIFEMFYIYDAVGNRIQTIDTSGAGVLYSYDVTDKLLSAGDITYGYDATGNLISRTDSGGNITFYNFDSENQLTRVIGNTETVEYVYDAEGRRIERRSASGSVRYLVDPLNLTGYSQVVVEYNPADGSFAEYSWGLGLISQNRNGNVSYYHSDASHNVRLLTDDTGTITDKYDYQAFGPSINTVGGTVNVYRFAGERLDATTGLIYLRARYYDPDTGRFISRDPFDGNMRDPVSLHRYLYANMNPVTYYDPTGRFSIAETTTSMATVGDVMKGYTSMLGNTFIAVRKNIRTYITIGSAGYSMAINLLSAGYATPSVINLANNSRKLMAKGFETIKKTIGSQMKDYFKSLLFPLKVKILDLISFDIGSILSNITSGKGLELATYKPKVENINSVVEKLNIVMEDGVLITRMILEDRNLVAESLNMRMNEDMAVLAGKIKELLKNKKP